MGDAFRRALSGLDPKDVDLTEVYQTARRAVFAAIEPLAVRMKPGQAVLLHRHLLHGVAPWGDKTVPTENGRMIAYFRPEYPFGSNAWHQTP
jgi:hypothetical protein